MKNYFYLLALLAFSFVYAQENNEPELWITYEYTPKEGMNQKFEDAIAEKTRQFNTAENSAYTAVLITGSDAENGLYERIMPRRTNDWYSESINDEESKFWKKNVAKHIQTGKGPYVWQRNKSLSINFDEPRPAKYFRSLTRVLKNGNNEDFWRYLKRYSKVLKKARPDVQQGVFVMSSGGNTNTVRILTTFNNPNNRQGKTKNSTVKDIYDQMFGEGTMEDDYQKYNERLVEWSRPTFDFMMREELSTKL